ncbi:outer membrane beta-barrel protein [Catalinimonas niigatensis]|uniref:outer membrane beta-barrel protein n=1 Tax=Catalinimonas niigatensis TaxID=1397264 RepID=UPI0026657CDD|nr:outer membrane beta-barrel protein [Catalinimonas niigatensis]WPP51393.1 outer membrane beta-barrel protein [Catalinimonas niigatensis]
MAKCISFILILLLTYTFHQTYSQSAFQEAIIITQEKDSLHGYLTLTNDNEYLFTQGKNQVEQLLSPENIGTILLNKNTVFESKRIVTDGNEQAIFLKLLVRGKSKLYQHPNSKKSTYWVETEDGKMYALTNERLESYRDGRSYIRYSNTYRGVLKNIFNDQPQLFSQIDKLKYTEKSISGFYQQYHEKLNLPYEILSEETPYVALTFGLIVGLQRSSVEFIGTQVLESHLSPSFSSSSNFSLGIFAEAQPIEYRHSAIKLEVQYQSASYSNPTLTLNTNILRISPAYKYRIAPNAKLKPFLSLGPTFNFLLSLKDQSTVDGLDYNWLQSGRMQYGLEAGTGISTKINQKQDLFLELRYGVHNGNHLSIVRRFVPGVGYISVQDLFDSISQSLGILVGIRF